MGLSFRQYSAKNDLMKNKISKIIFVVSILKVIFVISLFLSLFLWSIPVLSLNSKIWMFFQERSGMVLDDSVKSYNERVIDFFFNNVNLDFLNENEMNHMQDVRNILIITNGLAIFSFVALLLDFLYLSKSSKRDKMFILDAVKKVSLSVFGITLILTLLAITNFYSVFTYFHQIFFIKNFVFPPDSLLKILYPDEFFYGLGAFYLISIMIVSLAVAVIAHRLKLK